MAHRKAGGTAKNLRDSNPKYLGIKLSAGQNAAIGNIIVRQRGTKMIAGKNVKMGVDHTLFAIAPGQVKFTRRKKISFNGRQTTVGVVHVV
ncbi:MAG: 50S ribosomal protein L27 [Patescibacteria group bacterium]